MFSKSIKEMRIAYIAPEIPALSATFVYQEILELEKLGLKINPVSIHRPINIAVSKELEKLEAKTFYLYKQPLKKFIISNIYLSIFSPIRYFSTMLTVFFDVARMGLLSHVGRVLIYRFIIAA